MINLSFIKVVTPNERGVAAAEFVLWLSALTLPIINAVDLSFYTYQSMQVETAAEAAVNAAWQDCDGTAATPASPPALVTCVKVVTQKKLVGDMLAAAQSTSLGTAVLLPPSSISEGYYCPPSGGGDLTASTAIGTADSAPYTQPTVPACTTGKGAGAPAGDYISATVTYTYTPLFSSASILSLLGATVTKTAYLRLDK